MPCLPYVCTRICISSRRVIKIAQFALQSVIINVGSLTHHYHLRGCLIALLADWLSLWWWQNENCNCSRLKCAYSKVVNVFIISATAVRNSFSEITGEFFPLQVFRMNASSWTNNSLDVCLSWMLTVSNWNPSLVICICPNSFADVESGVKFRKWFSQQFSIRTNWISIYQ